MRKPLDFWTVWTQHPCTRNVNGRQLDYAAHWAGTEEEEEMQCYAVQFYIDGMKFYLYQQ